MKRIFLALFLLASLSLSAQIPEICLDSADNDLDNLIDCADPDCMDGECKEAFPCQSVSQLYQVRDGDDLWFWDGSAWVDVVGWTNPNGIQVNAMGYNVEDGFIYGIDPDSNPNNLVRITATGIDNLGPIPGLDPASWFVGDFDLNGNLYITRADQNRMFRIDVSTMTVTEIAFSGLSGNLDMADWTYVPVMNRFYGVTTANNPTVLRAMNLDGSFHADYPLASNNVCTAGFGAVFSDANGTIYAYCNAGEFYEITPDATFDNFTLTSISDKEPNMSRNDGASCPLGNGITTGDDCCEEVLAILRELQGGGGVREPGVRERKAAPVKNTATAEPEEETIAVLMQNAPNPFHENTVIEYQIKQKKARKAFIYVFDLNGNLKFSEEVPVTPRGEYVIEGKRLESGMYLYTLIVDNTAVDTKRMILLD